jgi:hypothetical protein
MDPHPRAAKRARSDCVSESTAASEIEYAGRSGKAAKADVDRTFTIAPRERASNGRKAWVNARKGADLRRDPRFALHSATVDPVDGLEAEWPGEAKIAGRAIPTRPTTEEFEGDYFHADIAEVVHTHLNERATMLVIEWWTPSHGLRSVERE